MRDFVATNEQKKSVDLGHIQNNTKLHASHAPACSLTIYSLWQFPQSPSSAAHTPCPHILDGRGQVLSHTWTVQCSIDGGQRCGEGTRGSVLLKFQERTSRWVRSFQALLWGFWWPPEMGSCIAQSSLLFLYLHCPLFLCPHDCCILRSYFCLVWVWKSLIPSASHEFLTSVFTCRNKHIQG